MAQPKEALRDALAAAERLPLNLRRELAQRLLASAASKQNSITIQLRRLARNKQSRLAELMDNWEGTLTASERGELRALGNELDETMLSNSIALARAARPELFDTGGRLIKRRLRQAIGARSSRENFHR